jgi:SPP1 gp7 family putative phage head morphogenesis protein
MYDALPGGPDAPVIPLSQGVVDQAMRSTWKGENYSSRVWKNRDVLASEGGKIIDAGVTAGKSIQQMTMELSDLMNVGAYAAARLLRTEVNRMHNDATVQSYKTMGVKEYIYLATLDARTCSVCGALDEKVFQVSEAQTGVNLPPMHPNDRCTIAPKIPGVNSDGSRIARDPETGRNYKVSAGMTYEKWRKDISKKYGADSLEKAQKKYWNRRADAVELKSLKSVLGRDAPKDLAELQDWKYNNSKEFEKMQRQAKTFEKIDSNGAYPLEYKQKLKDTYRYFRGNGFEFTAHALNRTVGQKHSAQKVNFTQEELLDILKQPPNFEQPDGKQVRFYSNIAVIQAKDTGEIVSVVTRSTSKDDWRKI